MDDDFCGGKTIEWDLREEMVLCLVLHSAHHQQPEDVLLPVISAGDDLVVDVRHIWLLRIGLLALVVADQHEGGVEARNEFGDDPVDQVVMPVDKTPVIEAQACHVDLHKLSIYIISIFECGDEGIEPPLEVQELKEVDLVLVLDVLIEFNDVGEHVVHVVLGTPPLRGKASEEGGLKSAEDVEGRGSVVHGGVADPADEDLRQAEGKDAEPPVGGHAADEPAGAHEERQ